MDRCRWVESGVKRSGAVCCSNEGKRERRMEGGGMLTWGSLGGGGVRRGGSVKGRGSTVVEVVVGDFGEKSVQSLEMSAEAGAGER